MKDSVWEQNGELQINVIVTHEPYPAPSGGPTLQFRDLNVRYQERNMIGQGSHGPQYGDHNLERIFSIPHEFAKLTVSCRRSVEDFRPQMLWHEAILVAELINSDSEAFSDFMSAAVIPYGQRCVLRDRENIIGHGALIDYVLRDICFRFDASIIDICGVRDAVTDVISAPRNTAERERRAALVSLSVAKFLTEINFVPALLEGNQEVIVSPLVIPCFVESRHRQMCTPYIREALDMIFLMRKKS